jgi:hypothetical protein
MVALQFHGDEIVTFQHEGLAFVAMRRVVENLGLNWGSQHTKLAAVAAKYDCRDIATVDAAGRSYPMMAMPVTKLPLWLATINPNKIADQQKREKIELYQSESAIALHDYWTRGFAIDRKRLDGDEAAVDDLAGELRKLRLSDKAIYKKLTDTIAATSADYQAAKLVAPKRIPALFIRIQDTFHLAVTGKTAQELVIENADGSKPLVGMRSYAGNPDRIKVADVRTGKNYLEAIPFRKLENLYEQLLLFAEHKVLAGERMSLQGWAEQIDKLLVHNGYQPWKLYNGYKAEVADAVAAHELGIYKRRLSATVTVPALR